MKRARFFLVISFCLLTAAAYADQIILDDRPIGPPPLLDETPESRAVPGAVQAIINEYKVWGLGQTLTICFFGGDRDLRALFASAAAEWDNAAPGITLDPGEAPVFRDCILPSGKASKSEIRVAFDRKGKWSGDWSRQGTDAAQLNPDQPSMNIGTVREERLASTLLFTTKESLKGKMLHELGHALGLQHEHQSPDSKCEDELLWEDKVYPQLAEPPNKWDRPTVDANLRRLFRTERLLVTVYDPKSIMHYSLPIDWFKLPNPTCALPINETLSTIDRAAIAALYPGTAKERKEFMARLGGRVVRIANELKLEASTVSEVERRIRLALPDDLRATGVVPKLSQCIVSGDIAGNTGNVQITMGGCNVHIE